MKPVLYISGPFCKRCGKVYGLEAHHIEPVKFCPELALDANNGVTLCWWCHAEYHRIYGIRSSFDELVDFLWEANRE